ncbi:MAG TPA: RluA family pseudouridine synthase [Planctomycetota bacterium]|nr:RluA family pseudouridine synthase [Planctomycetota bacterium]
MNLSDGSDLPPRSNEELERLAQGESGGEERPPAPPGREGREPSAAREAAPPKVASGPDADDEEPLARTDEPSPEPSDEAPAAPARPREKRVIEFTFEGTSQRLDTFLSERVPEYSRQYLKRLIETGYVQILPVGPTTLKPSLRLRTGQKLRLTIPPPVELQLRPDPIPIEILYEDDAIAVINKPAGLAVHPAPAQSGATLVNALLHWIRDLSGIAGVERPGIVHRLDRETSGVIVIAKHDQAHHGLAEQFKERQVKKVYRAISRGEPRSLEGRLDYPIGRSRTHSKKMVVRTDGQGRAAITDYRVIETYRGYALIECYPYTGRTHQIRVHLAHIQLPIAGDKLYGREKVVWRSDLADRPREKEEIPMLRRQALHAMSLYFHHPMTGEEMTFTAPLPEDMEEVIRALDEHRSLRG